MSTRQIRRLLREREKRDDADDVPPVTSPIIRVNRPTFSFAAYRDIIDSSEDSDDDTGEESLSDSDSSEDPTDVENSPRSPACTKTQLQRGGNKGCKARKETPEDSGDGESDSDDALLDSIAAVQIKSVESTVAATKNRLECLRIDPRAFRVAGMDTRAPGRSRLCKGLTGSLQSRNWLTPGIAPKIADKLRSAVSQHMRIKGTIEHKTKRERFTVELSERYKNVQALCMAAIDTQDPALFRQVLDANPQHVEVLLRASSIHTLQGQHEEAFKLLYFALQIFQAALPPRFSPWKTDDNGYYNTWLPSSYTSNLMVYRLLVLYMISVERQGQWEVALAVCKLLLLLDFPNDVAHALLHIDMYLLNNPGIEMYKFSVAYANALEYPVPLHWILPNFAFAVAMDYATKERTQNIETPASEADTEMVQQFLTLSEDELGFRFQPGDQATEVYGAKRAQLYLLRAILQYPDVIPLLSREPFASELAVYTQMEPFVSWVSETNKTDVLLLKCYLKKTCDTWRNESLFFLSQTANLIVDIYSTERGSLILDSFRDLWSAFRSEQEIPVIADGVIVAEFDLASHSLPMALE
ncbi:transcriptional repressor TCF25, putative [Babesia ovis]|uniref:Transcriptional repressor TCF25, putative n=1 Tax=Babesia ovis TaxID=5869 RepID=A0A9W5WVQ8_BABOV|nr:transcriptional repressor TCF25, putative [Babesia ovis]